MTTVQELIDVVQEHHHLTPPDAGAHALTAEALQRGWGVSEGADPEVVREAVVICRRLQEDMGDPDVDLLDNDEDQWIIRTFILDWRGLLDAESADYSILVPEDRALMAQIGAPDSSAGPEDVFYLVDSGLAREILVSGEGRVLVQDPSGPVKSVSEPLWETGIGDVRETLQEDRERLDQVVEVLRQVDGEDWTVDDLEDGMNHDFSCSRPVRTSLRGSL